MSKILTVDDVLTNVNSLKELSDKDISINISAKLVKILQELSNVIQVFEKGRSQLFDLYAEEVDEFGKVKIKDEFIEVFNEKYNALLKEEVEIDFSKINVDDLEGINIKTSTLLSLEWLIEFN